MIMSNDIENNWSLITNANVNVIQTNISTKKLHLKWSFL
jgi:hypothetical protein